MRTTITLDDDVVALLEKAGKQRKTTFKTTINDALRQGLAAMASPRRRSTKYRTPAVSLGRCLAGNLDDVADVLAVSEGDSCR